MSLQSRLSTSSDRRVQRSQQSLIDALIELMIEQGYEKTTIAEIAERANVGRSTFYAHFADKEALLRESLRDLRTFLCSPDTTCGRTDVHPALAFSLPMLEHIAESRDLFSALVTRRSTAVDLLHAMLVELVCDTLSSTTPPPTVIPRLAAEHVIGSFLSICSWWMSEAPTLTPTQVDANFRQLMGDLGARETAAPPKTRL
jgi:AcrR family transcriptional regulator